MEGDDNPYEPPGGPAHGPAPRRVTWAAILWILNSHLAFLAGFQAALLLRGNIDSAAWALFLSSLACWASFLIVNRSAIRRLRIEEG